MKPLYVSAAVCGSLCAFFVNGFSEERSFEERLSRLEQDAGVDLRKESTTFLLFGEFIYWKTSLDGVAYATTAKVDENLSGDPVLNKYKTRTVHFEYSPAFQIGIGANLPRDHWDVAASWLRSTSEGKDKAHGELSQVLGSRVILDSIGLIQPLDSPPSMAKADCRVQLNVVDLALGRTFVWSRYFWFRPYGGVRAAWVDLDWKIAFTRPVFADFGSDQTYTRLHIDNTYSAAGFVGGFDSRWNLYKGFGLFSKASASLIFGTSSERTRQKFFTVPAGQTVVTENLLKAHNTTHAVKAIFDIALGLKWERDFGKAGHVFLWIGYDFFYLPSVTQKTIVQQTRVRDRADLSFEGVMMGAKVDF